MHRAVSEGDEVEVIKLLRAGPARLEEWDHFGQRPLALAAARRGIRMVRLMTQRGANLNASNVNGTTVLHEAAHRDHEERGLRQTAGTCIV